MARIRSIKPDIASDAKLAKLPSDVFRTFILCISQADDYGLLTGSPKTLAGVLYPANEAIEGRAVAKWVEVLVEHGFLRKLTSADGLPILHLVNWSKHQRIEKPSASTLSRSLDAATFADVARKLRESVPKSSPQNDGRAVIPSPQNDERSGTSSPLEVGSRKKEVGEGGRKGEVVQGDSPVVEDLPPREIAGTAGSHDPKATRPLPYPYRRGAA
jgi:hypothetical protein